MSYIRVSLDNVLDTATFKFIPVPFLKDGSVVLVPSTLWEYGNVHQHSFTFPNGVSINEHRVMEFTLNECTISVAESGRVFLKFNGRDGLRRVFEISCQFYESDEKDSKRVDYSYHLVGAGDTKYRYYSSYVMLRFAFTRVSELGKIVVCIGKGFNTDFRFISYGLSQNQYRIQYKGKVLGTSYAWVFGTWALLLDDSFRFDSVAVLSGVSSDLLLVDKFLYTENHYVVKAMTLLG